jgi:putative SOS response-associated peptidase YedK
MCGRVALTAPASTITEIFQVDVLPEVLPRYNVAPTQQVAAIVDADGAREMTTLRWGLVPFWAKDIKVGYRMINARSETVRKKPSFRAAFKRRRALILADGFYEWQRIDKKTKIPHVIGMADGRPFAMAGLWERWTDTETGDELRSCTIVTTEGNALMKPIHDRMPVILPPTRWQEWLDPENADLDALEAMLTPAPADQRRARRVSTRVNNARHEGPGCQDPYEGDTE